MIQKKYSKGKSAEEIAEELEITEDIVKKLLDGVVWPSEKELWNQGGEVREQ